jgi:hypothetical protein
LGEGAGVDDFFLFFTGELSPPIKNVGSSGAGSAVDEFEGFSDFALVISRKRVPNFTGCGCDLWGKG